jgi:hypothetical protein
LLNFRLPIAKFQNNTLNRGFGAKSGKRVAHLADREKEEFQGTREGKPVLQATVHRNEMRLKEKSSLSRVSFFSIYLFSTFFGR